jgi:hypothetical protein
VLLKMVFTSALGAFAVPAFAAIETIDLPQSRQQGVDMVLIDEDALPTEPELAKHLAKGQNSAWSGAAINPTTNVHHLYADLRLELDRYREQWGALPQITIPRVGGTVGPRRSGNTCLTQSRRGTLRASDPA